MEEARHKIDSFDAHLRAPSGLATMETTKFNQARCNCEVTLTSIPGWACSVQIQRRMIFLSACKTQQRLPQTFTPATN